MKKLLKILKWIVCAGKLYYNRIPDWNASKLQRTGAKILLCEYDKDLRQNYLSQLVKPTMPKYTLRNYTQWISGGLFKSPHYDGLLSLCPYL